MTEEKGGSEDPPLQRPENSEKPQNFASSAKLCATKNNSRSLTPSAKKRGWVRDDIRERRNDCAGMQDPTLRTRREGWGTQKTCSRAAGDPRVARQPHALNERFARKRRRAAALQKSRSLTSASAEAALAGRELQICQGRMTTAEASHPSHRTRRGMPQNFARGAKLCATEESHPENRS
jgi:hypothetical protein